MNIQEIFINFLIAATGMLGITLLSLYVLGIEGVKESLGNTGKMYAKFKEETEKNLTQISLTFTPKKGGLKDYYEKLLLNFEITLENFFKIKNGMFVVVLIFMFCVGFTDMKVKINDIYTSFNYNKDPMLNASKYNEEEKQEIIKIKNQLFDEVLEKADVPGILQYDELSAQYVLSGIIDNLGNKTGIDKEIIAAEMLVKLRDYTTFKKMDFLNPFKIAIIFYFFPEIIIYIMKFLSKSEEKAEKNFLKRLIIMNGSIKPTDFMMVLAELIDKSKYYKKILLEIEDCNKKNYEENTKIYQKYIQKAEDLETKLFFEKLDEANNYDFDQAITNIKNEFNLDKRMQTRKCKKRVESIHVYGLLGFMALIVMIIFYLLMPWMTAYDLGSMM